MAYNNMDPTAAHWMQPAPPQMHHQQQHQQHQHQQQVQQQQQTTIPFILQLSDQTTAPAPIEIASLEMCEMETQTIPQWSELLRLTIQNYLAHWLKQLLDKNVKGNTCVHLRGITLEEIMAIVVERHNALCVDPEVVAKKQSEVVQIPIEQFSETEAAATAMVDLLNEMQQQEFQPDFNEPVATHDDDDDWGTSNTGSSSTAAKKVARKRPAESTKEELMRKGVKIIRCDPPEHIQQQAQNASANKDPNSTKRRHVPPKQWFQCETCSMKLRDISKLARHASTHTEIRLHWCTKCNKRYKSRDQLTKHVREVHTKTRVKQFKMFCPYCGKGFHERQRRDDHIAVHTGESRYKCQNCDKAFRSRKALQMHNVTKHDTDKSVKCPLCDCIHPARSYLGKHLLSAHKAQISQTVKAVFVNKCLACNVEFDTEQMLYQHVEQTHGRDCEACRRRERTKENHIQYAVNCGMNPDEAAAKPLDELKAFVKVDKKRREEERAEKKARENKLIADKAIKLGMDREAAQDPEAATKYIKEKKKEKLQKIVKNPLWYKMYDSDDDAGDDDHELGEFNMDEEADDIEVNIKVNPQLLVAKENRQLRAEVEKLRDRINKNAMELALDIVEELDAKDVFRTGIVNQEMAVIKAEFIGSQEQEWKPAEIFSAEAC